MFQSTLWLAIGIAVGSAALTLFGTGSLLFAALAYIGAGMAVLTAFLVAEMLFGDADTEAVADEAGVPVTSQG